MEAQSAALNLGHSDLDGKVRVLWSGILVDLHLPPCSRVEKKKEEVGTSCANLDLKKSQEEQLEAGWTTLGGAALDAGGRSGPRWTSDA